MPLITTAIPEQNFELVRDQIGLILKLELDNQITLNGEYDLTGVGYWIERSIPFSKEELPAINVRLAPSEYTGHNVQQQNGAYNYHIEVYTNAATEGDDSGDTLAAIRAQRLLGLCRAILMNNAYLLLGYTPGSSIIRRTVGKIEIALPQAEGDGLHTVYGRLNLLVEMPETSPLKVGVPFEQNTTKIKINQTNKGFQIVTVQP